MGSKWLDAMYLLLWIITCVAGITHTMEYFATNSAPPHITAHTMDNATHE